MRKNSKLANLYLALMIIITYIPIVITVVYSFNESKISTVWSGVSLKWYQELFRDRDIREALKNSLVLAFFCCSLSAIIGTLGAVGMSKRKTKINHMIEYLATIPIMIPEIILGMVFLAVFSLLSIPFGMTTLVIAHTSFCIPYVLLNVKARLAGMDESLEEAARDLGATRFRAFIDIVLPLISPAILSGVLLSFAMSFDDVVISIFVTGPRVNILPVKIYTKIKTGVTPEINALATVLLAATVCMIFLSGWIGRRAGRLENKEEEDEKGN
ncbi:MAG: ABC transporter permease [Lachnospiraceae bacterium]|nr:ABC transporter permease [Lachnospiraceae bacterium]